MAREPQPRTSSMSVQEADAKGLVRNSLIDSPQNWDSFGKQKLRKGFLQTLDASEKYINEGPLGQSAEEWENFQLLWLTNRQKYMTENFLLTSDGIIGQLQLPLQDFGETVKWQVRGEIVLDPSAAPDGTVSLTSSMPSLNSVWTASLTEHDGVDNPTQYYFSAVSPTEGPVVGYIGGNVHTLKFNWFLTLDTYSVIDLNFNINGVGTVNVIESSWMENRLLYEAYVP